MKFDWSKRNTSWRTCSLEKRLDVFLLDMMGVLGGGRSTTVPLGCETSSQNPKVESTAADHPVSPVVVVLVGEGNANGDPDWKSPNDGPCEGINTKNESMKKSLNSQWLIGKIREKLQKKKGEKGMLRTWNKLLFPENEEVVAVFDLHDSNWPERKIFHFFSIKRIKTAEKKMCAFLENFFCEKMGEKIVLLYLVMKNLLVRISVPEIYRVIKKRKKKIRLCGSSLSYDPNIYRPMSSVDSKKKK